MAFVDVVKEANFYNRRFTIWPRRWRAYGSSICLSWTVFLFGEDAIKEIPDEPGVYAFLIQPSIASDLNASYLIYIGKTTRSLRTRFQEYLREAKNPSGRPKIVTWLNPFKGFIYFSCAVLTSSVSPETVEGELLNAFIPPANEQYPAEVSRIIRAFS